MEAFRHEISVCDHCRRIEILAPASLDHLVPAPRKV